MWTAAWGQLGWDLLSLSALNYPRDPSPERQASMNAYIEGFLANLPCDGCSLHAKQYVAQHPPDLSSDQALFAWVVAFHNEVNKRTGKRTYTVDEAKTALIERYFGDHKNLSRAQQIRREDARTIERLEKQLNDAGGTQANNYALGAMITGILTLLLLLAAVIATFVYMYRRHVSRFTAI